ncbi:unnamed protein product [Arabidopsis lyrata]|nr:unnamed protein product [Arabidopsis lyrata]
MGDQTQIWDPGVSNIGSENGGNELRLNRCNNSRDTLFSARISKGILEF